ncbi:TonB-dependent receptor [Saccharibacter sp. 17.LH.SD]|uniref:TonB-dependent receptor n=1 Tax=Saccharibacter sp. 17.LH.SD TaxID=2689393 RepID=UPI001368904F|nr:TonB-dependent receptor [Saccharibacter sp. 17.LH.SD]MXV44862.1 TonB-dependent receptor [Saccharibacter sp. 17.LH.SD]
MSRFVRCCLKPVSAVFTLGGVTGAYADTVASQQAAIINPQSKNSSHSETNKSPQSPSVTTKNVEKIRVIGHPFNTLHASNDMGRMPQDVMHTPQTIDVVPHELIEQQNAKSLDEALRSVPGITASVGEGAGGMNGDQFLIRGFPAQNDIYEDGLRDFGVYTRDSFDYDSVNVIKGPSSEVFGNGTTGGAINAITKVPTLINHINADFSGGSGQYYRGTIDVNHRIDDHTAFRIEGMGNSNNVVGRHDIYSHRWGLAPSISLGLGTDTTVVFQLMHLSNDAVPDYGLPVARPPGSAVGRPVSAFGIPRSNWYGKDQDHDRTSDTMETMRLMHRFNSHLKLHNDLRFGEFSRSFEASKAVCDANCNDNVLTDPGSVMVARTTNGQGVHRNIGGGPIPYKQWSWSVQDVISLQADFKTGFLTHQLIVGADMEYVHDHRHQYTFTKPVSAANLLNPDPNIGDVGRVRATEAPNNLTYFSGVGRKPNSSGYGFDTGIFLYDQIWFTKWLSIKGGFRWDRWQTAYNATGGTATLPDIKTKSMKNEPNPDLHIPNTTDVINPSASLIITPNRWQTFYFTYSSSTTPTGMYVTNGSIPIRPSSGGAYNTRPERARLYEVGSKMSLLHDRLGATISLFRLEKSNALTTDPLSSQVISTGDQQRNQGLELSLGGMILPGWNITATYALYDPKTTGSTTASNIGKMIQYVPHNQATVWTAYEAFPGRPWNFTIGGGLTWRQGVWLDTANTERVPANVEFDMMFAHRINRHWTLTLNGYNLSNRLNYNSLFPNYVTPAPGRSFLGRISMNY